VTANATVAVVDAEAPEGVEAAVQALLATPEELEPATSASAMAPEGVSESGEPNISDGSAPVASEDAPGEDTADS
jgi:hypothetical protein